MKKCKTCDKEFSNRGIYAHEKYCLKNLNKVKNTHGGYRKGSGYGKSGWYNGIHCDSSWELAYVLYCEMHNIKITRYKGELEYVSNDGNVHKYTPDFIINDETIIEIKGYMNESALNKAFQYPNIVLLDKSHMVDILKQVEFKHGKDFISLYDGVKPIKTHKAIKLSKPTSTKKPRLKKVVKLICENCGIEFIKTSRNKEQFYCTPTCFSLSTRKFNIEFDELKELVWKYPTETVGKMYGVSGKAIEKRCIKFGIDKPPRGYWQKLK